MRGIVFYEGPSAIDGSPIIAVATLKSSNRKTGDMIQTWILRADIDPVQAIQAGSDDAICGDCVHRGDDDRPRTCYVNVGQAPLAVFRGYQRGIYNRGTIAELPDRPVRMGAYGDPAAVPWHAWAGITNRKVWTGYTHQWKQPFAAPFRAVLMASCDSVADMAEAAANGWRAFLVTPADAERPEGTLTCPSETHNMQCADCGLCKGAAIAKAPHISIPAHGSAKAFVQAG